MEEFVGKGSDGGLCSGVVVVPSPLPSLSHSVFGSFHFDMRQHYPQGARQSNDNLCENHWFALHGHVPFLSCTHTRTHTHTHTHTHTWTDTGV